MVSTFARLLSGSTRSTQDDLTSRLGALGQDTDTLANSLLAILVGSTVDMSQGMYAWFEVKNFTTDDIIGLVHILNLYVDNKASGPLKSLTAKDKLDPQEQSVVQGFVLEALRTSSPRNVAMCITSHVLCRS